MLRLRTRALLLVEYDAPLVDVAWVAVSKSFVLFLSAMLNDAVVGVVGGCQYPAKRFSRHLGVARRWLDPG